MCHRIISTLGFMIQDSEFRIQDSGLRIKDSMFRVAGLFRPSVSGFGFPDPGLRIEARLIA
jgi:hypothetical protein